MDVIMLGYDIQGPVLGDKMHTFNRAVVCASFGVLKGNRGHLESGGLASFVEMTRPTTNPCRSTVPAWPTNARLRLIGLAHFDCKEDAEKQMVVLQRNVRRLPAAHVKLRQTQGQREQGAPSIILLSILTLAAGHLLRRCETQQRCGWYTQPSAAP